jgi:hypothetical protein
MVDGFEEEVTAGEKRDLLCWVITEGFYPHPFEETDRILHLPL